MLNRKSRLSLVLAFVLLPVVSAVGGEGIGGGAPSSGMNTMSTTSTTDTGLWTSFVEYLSTWFGA